MSDPVIDYWNNEFPELIDERTDWQVKIVCSNCLKGDLSEQLLSTDIKNFNSWVDGQSVYQDRRTFYYTDFVTESLSKKKCPHCHYPCELETKEDILYFSPLKTKTIRYRTIYLEPQKRNWWGRKLPRKKFVEEIVMDEESECKFLTK